MKNATSHNRRDSPNWTARNATILAGFRVPAIDSLRAGAMNVTNVYADNSTTLGLLAVSQNGTTENFTAESALVKNSTRNREHRNAEMTSATNFRSAGTSEFTGWVNTSVRLELQSGFGVENSSINVTNADLNMPLISASNDAWIDFPGIEAAALQFKQSQGVDANVLQATNLTTNNSDFENLETGAVLATNLRAEKLDTVIANALGTVTSPGVSAGSATANKL